MPPKEKIMTRLLIVLTALWMSFSLNAQIPLTITEFNFEDVPLIDIAVGDLDDNGRTDIYVIGEETQEIIRLTNLGNGTNFIKTTYYQLDKQPMSMGTISFNGGDDMYFMLDGEPGINVLYGKDPFISEKQPGEKMLDTVGGLTQVDLSAFNFSQMLTSSDTSGNLHFQQIVFGSFNYIFPYTSSSLPFVGTPGQISSFGLGDTIVFFVPDISSGQLFTGQASLNLMNSEVDYEDQLDLMDGDLVHPLASLTYSDTMGNRMMFVLDTGSHEIYKYVFQDDSFTKTTLDASFTEPTMMALGFVDGDNFPDLVVADQDKLWLLSNVPSRSNGQAELIVIYDEPIGEFVLTDFDGDGIDDIASVPVSRDKVLVARNDLMTSTQEIETEPFGYWPNPVTTHLYFSATIVPDRVELISTNGQIYLPETSAGKIDLSGVPAGIYIVRTSAEGKIYADKISKK